MTKNMFAGMLDSGKKKKIFLTILATVLFTSAIIGIAVGVNSRTSNHTKPVNKLAIKAESTAHDIVKSSCSITLHPDLCYSTISTIPEMAKKVKTPKDVVILAVDKTKEIVQRNYFTIKKLTAQTGLTKREKVALHDCLETVAESLHELDDVVRYLKTYRPKKLTRGYVDDILTLMSSTLTNQETCIDGFSHDTHEKEFRKSLIAGEIHGEKLCSNSLALIKNMTDTDMIDQDSVNSVNGRKLVEDENENGVKWPEWLSVGDRRLLQSGTVHELSYLQNPQWLLSTYTGWTTLLSISPFLRTSDPKCMNLVTCRTSCSLIVNPSVLYVTYITKIILKVSCLRVTNL